MKTQVNTFEMEQRANNKVMLISLIVLGSILFTVLIRDYFYGVYTETTPSFKRFNPKNNYNRTAVFVTKQSDYEKERTNAKLITPIEPCCENKVKHELEIEKMKTRMEATSRNAFQQTLATFMDVEEPELLIQKVNETIEAQKAQFRSVNAERKLDSHLQEMYTAKNNEVLRAIEINWQTKNYAKVENEDALEIEVWMTNSNNSVTEHSRKADHDLVAQYEQTNNEVSNTIETNHNFENYCLVENEDPLEVENWMTNSNNSVTEHSRKADPVLFAQYEQTNNEVSNTIETNHNFENYCLVENEDPLEVENWMTNSINSVTEHSRKADHDLVAQYEQTNNEVSNTIETNQNFENYFTLENEEVLEVDEWMTNNKRWNFDCDQMPSLMVAVELEEALEFHMSVIRQDLMAEGKSKLAELITKTK